MQSDRCDFEIVPNNGPTEEQKHDLIWLDSKEGVDWCVSQMPRGRNVPKGMEREVILRRIVPLFSNSDFARRLIPKAVRENKVMFPKKYHQITKGDGEVDGFHYFLIWQMPYYYTMEVGHVNAYNDWLNHGRPWFHTSNLAHDVLQTKMYDICKAIARERKNVRLR